jgi:pimeloyl-ACP methyl ester carboxylesterase
VAAERDGEVMRREVRTRIGAKMRQTLERSLAIGATEARWPDPPASERLSEIQPPLLSIVGTLDLLEIRALPLPRQRAGRLFEVEDAGHLVNLEQRRAFLDAAQQFIDAANSR